MTAVKQATCSEGVVQRHHTTCRPEEFLTTVWRMWWRQSGSHRHTGATTSEWRWI